MRQPLKIKIAAVAAMLFFVGNAFAENPEEKLFRYDVVKVVDGDTVIVTDGNVRFIVRLAGIDAPEKKQRLGNQAAERLADLVLGKSVRIVPGKKPLDGFGRIIGAVYVEDQNVAASLAQEGWAYYYRPDCKMKLTKSLEKISKSLGYDLEPYIDAEQQAQEGKLGVWEKKTGMLPCEFRKK